MAEGELETCGQGEVVDPVEHCCSDQKTRYPNCGWQSVIRAAPVARKGEFSGSSRDEPRPRIAHLAVLLNSTMGKSRAQADTSKNKGDFTTQIPHQ